VVQAQHEAVALTFGSEFGAHAVWVGVGECAGIIFSSP
jgi:hypothetical protein